MEKCRAFAIVVAGILHFGMTYTANAADSKGALSVSLENDAFTINNDGHYTSGLEISYVSDSYMPNWFYKAISWLPFYDLGDEARFSWSLGQKMFTPEDIKQESLIVNDRPYAGWLFTSIGLITEKRYATARHVESLEIILGVVGPNSGAENTQRILHDYLGTAEPKGWDNQLHDEYTADLRYRRAWLVPVIGKYVDVLPTAGFTFGTSQRFVEGGFGLRLGNNIDSDYGPPLIRPSITGSHYFRAERKFYWYLFAAVQGQYVDYNVFLDGNRDGNSHSVVRNDWVGELQSGIVMGYDNWRLSLTSVRRSREFELQREPDKFGSITFSYRF